MIKIENIVENNCRELKGMFCSLEKAIKAPWFPLKINNKHLHYHELSIVADDITVAFKEHKYNTAVWK